jgi:hypothetical protein
MERIRLLFVEGQLTKVVLEQTCMGIFFINSVSDTISTILLLPIPSGDRRGPQFEKHCSRCCL